MARALPANWEKRPNPRATRSITGQPSNCRADLAADYSAHDCRSEDDSRRHRTSPQEVSGGRPSTARRRTDAADADLAAVWAATTARFGESAATGRRAGRLNRVFMFDSNAGLIRFRDDANRLELSRSTPLRSVFDQHCSQRTSQSNLSEAHPFGRYRATANGATS